MGPTDSGAVVPFSYAPHDPMNHDPIEARYSETMRGPLCVYVVVCVRSWGAGEVGRVRARESGRVALRFVL